MKIRIIHCILLFILIGCSAAGVPYTDDPYKKVYYAIELIDMGRVLPAERLAKDALDTFEKNGDKLGQAEAHFVLGNLYSNVAYRNYESFYKSHNLDYDETYGSSIKHYKISIKLFEEIGDYMQVAKSTFSMGNAYALDGNHIEQCRLYKLSKISYRKGLKQTNGQLGFEIRNPHFDDFEDMVNAYEKDHGCL